MDAGTGGGNGTPSTGRPPSPAPVPASSPGSRPLETPIDSLLETFKRSAARAMMEQYEQTEAGDTAPDVPGRLLRFRLPSARRLPFNLSLKRSRSGVSALSSAEESPPSESASSSSGTSCPLATVVHTGSSAPHRRSLPGLLEAAGAGSGAAVSASATPTHHANNNSSSTTDLAASGSANMESVDDREKEASEILHAMMSARIQMLEKDNDQTGKENEAAPGDKAQEQDQINVLLSTNQIIPLEQSIGEQGEGSGEAWEGEELQEENYTNLDSGETLEEHFVIDPKYQQVVGIWRNGQILPLHCIDPSSSSQQQLNEAVEYEESEDDKLDLSEPEEDSAQPEEMQPAVAPRKRRKIADYLASGVDPTKLEESVHQVKRRFKLGCECHSSNCFTTMNPDMVYRHRLNIAELTKAEQDMYLMGVTMASLTNPETTSRQKERQRLRALYVFQGKKVCLDAFLYLENCTHYQLKRIRKHVMTQGVTPRVHGNHGKIPHNTFSLDIYKNAITFLDNFTSKYASTPMSSRSSSKNKIRKKAIINLPPKITRKNIHEDYKKYCREINPPTKIMGYSSFRYFMCEQFSHVKFTKADKLVNDTVNKAAPSKPNVDADDPSLEKSDESLCQEITKKNFNETMSNSELDDGSNFTSNSSSANTYVITQVLPAGFVPVNFNNVQLQSVPSFQTVSIPDQQSVGPSILLTTGGTLAMPQQTTQTTYTFTTI